MTSEQPSVPRPEGWNTWDVRYHTGAAHLPSGLRLRFALAGADGSVHDAFTWRHGLGRLGHHTVGGEYAQVTVAAVETVLDIQLAGGTDVLDASAATHGTGGAEPASLVVVVDRMPGVGAAQRGPGVAERRAQRTQHGTTIVVDGQAWEVRLSAVAAITGDDGAVRLTVPARGSGPVHVSVSPAGTVDTDTGSAPADGRRVAAARKEALDNRLRTSGWLGDAGDAYVRAVTWNTVYAPDTGRVLTPTSRDFVCAEREGFYGTWALHTWDTFFTGLVANWIDPVYARGIFQQILVHADQDGMLPNRVSDDRGRTDDRSQPPVGALTVLKAYLGSGLSDETRERSLLSSSYATLRRWHDWWPAARRGPFDLLAWGSDPIDGDPESATADRTRRESGLDDSPMYDKAIYEPATHTMNLADVGLNALHIADGAALADIAQRLEDTSVAAELRNQADVAGAELNDLLWDPEQGGYRNRWADGTFSERLSPTMFYPLLTGAPSQQQARAIVDQLLDPDVLGGDPPLPSAARNDPSFSTRYWRGRVWAPMVYLAVEGLRRYGFDDEVSEISAALLRLFLREWEQHSHVRENYPVRPGEDVRALQARSDGLMSWGSLLAYLAFQELADPRADGWRFAHPGFPAELAAIPLGDGRLTVRSAERLHVSLDGEALLEAEPHVVVSAYQRTRRSVSGVAAARAAPGHVIVTPPPAATGAVAVSVAGESSVSHVGADGGIRIDVPRPGDPVNFHLTPLHDHEPPSG